MTDFYEWDGGGGHLTTPTFRSSLNFTYVQIVELKQCDG